MVDPVRRFACDRNAGCLSRAETERRVIVPLAEQEDMGPAGGARRIKGMAEQRPADPLPAKLRLNRQRAEQQGLSALLSDRDRCLLDAADQATVHPRGEGKRRARRVAGAEAVGGLVPAVPPEHKVEQGLDGGQVGGFERRNLERTHGWKAPGQQDGNGAGRSQVRPVQPRRRRSP